MMHSASHCSIFLAMVLGLDSLAMAKVVEVPDPNDRERFRSSLTFSATLSAPGAREAPRSYPAQPAVNAVGHYTFERNAPGILVDSAVSAKQPAARHAKPDPNVPPVVSPVPEASQAVLAAIGLAGVTAWSVRRQRARRQKA